MAGTIEKILVPDIGDAADVDVIEVLVKPGDSIAVDQPVITLEGDKATMEVPADKAGVVKSVIVKVGDKVSAGSDVLELEIEGASAAAEAEPAAEKAPAVATPAAVGGSQDIAVPDIGDASNVDVIEVLVKVGDEIAVDQPLITLEGDKATMEVPASAAGTVTEMVVKVGDKVSAGDVILKVASAAPTKASAPAASVSSAPATPAAQSAPAAKPAAPVASSGEVYAGPAVRRIAHELGIDLRSIQGTGNRGRITKDDLKRSLNQGGGAGVGGLSIIAQPKVDFAKFGDVEVEPLSKIKKLSGANLHRNWVSIPHVTQFDEADITDMEAFRKAHKVEAEKHGVKLTPIVFIMKAVVKCLRAHPTFNASLDASGENLIMKKYFHIGVAVDTPNGLVVPVIRDVDKKSLFQLAIELAAISRKARTKGLSMAEMQGGCFSISSLGGIGGTAFTPIINAPEVAILGVSKAATKPVYAGDSFVPRLMLPLSLSYDHRVIDGAEAARFITHLSGQLADIRRLLL